MNRWRQRLAELHGDCAEQYSPLSPAVQNVQNVQNDSPHPPFEHSEHCEPPTRLTGRSGASGDHALAAWGEAEAERAAIVEHDGRIPRGWAEGFARLDPDRPPGDVPLRRWQRFVDDVGLFLDCWAAYAEALGWEAFDLFGCDRDRPFARIDQSGLLWLLNGGKLVALSEDAAGIETRTGERHAYRRKPNQLGTVLAWELERGTCEAVR